MAAAQDLRTESPNLQQLKDEDLADRRPGVKAIYWRIVNGRGEQQRARRYAQGRAVVMRQRQRQRQCGATADEIRTARALANLALTLGPRPTGARWPSLAAWDRLLMREGRPQWRGTKFRGSAKGRRLLCWGKRINVER